MRKKRKKNLKVVIIDDEKDMCWLLENVLKEKHFSVFSANTGKKGICLVRREEPDVVLLDMRLRDMEGLEVLHKIKKLWPKIKVIIISAFSGYKIMKKAVSLGADDFLNKPFTSKDIIKAIKAVG